MYTCVYGKIIMILALVGRMIFGCIKVMQQNNTVHVTDLGSNTSVFVKYNENVFHKAKIQILDKYTVLS